MENENEGSKTAQTECKEAAQGDAGVKGMIKGVKERKRK